MGRQYLTPASPPRQPSCSGLGVRGPGGTAPGRVLVSSDLARTELLRAVRRVDVALAVPARSVLDAVVLLRATPAVLESAARLDPPTLRTLDAVHLAAALMLGDDLEAVVTYDDRLAEACRAYGVAVLAPA